MSLPMTFGFRLTLTLSNGRMQNVITAFVNRGLPSDVRAILEEYKKDAPLVFKRVPRSWKELVEQIDWHAMRLKAESDEYPWRLEDIELEPCVRVGNDLFAAPWQGETTEGFLVG